MTYEIKSPIMAKDAIDNINDADVALEYIDMANHGIVKTLQSIHMLLKDVHDRTDDAITKTLVEQCMLKVEGQLDY